MPASLDAPLGRREPLDWPVLAGLVTFHLGALWAPFHFSWFGLGAALLLLWLTCSLGISLGFHRMLSHRSFRAAPWLEGVLVTLGCLAFQGRPFYWVGVHRSHHGDPDGPNDPHSPRHGFWWAHMGWIVRRNSGGDLRERATVDLRRDPALCRLNSWCPWLQFASILALWGLGEAMHSRGVQTDGLSVVLWAVSVRVVVGYHATWLVNSATHRWGYTNYPTRDDARNLWWVALLTFGEGWHNNHHAHPYSARIGHRWFELDVSWLALRILATLRVVRSVRAPEPGFSRAAAHGSATQT